MGLFGGKKQKQVVGVDIGSSAVKVIELKKTKEGYELISAGVEALPAETVVDGAIMGALEVGAALDKIYTESKIKKKDVATSVSGHSVIVKKIQMPILEDDELYDEVHRTADQHIPFDLADVNLDYQVLGPSAQGDQYDVLLVAVKKEKINQYLGALMGRRQLAVVDVDAFAVQNSFEVNYEPDPDAAIALLNIGASVMNINIIRAGMTLTPPRDVSLGGKYYTEALQKELDLTFEEAEELKLGRKGGGASSVSDEQVDQILRATSELLVLEVQRTFDFFRSTGGGEAIRHIYVAGGATRTRGLLDLLRSELQLPVDELDPFRRVAPGKVNQDWLKEVAPRLAVSVGLGLRSFDEA